MLATYDRPCYIIPSTSSHCEESKKLFPTLKSLALETFLKSNNDSNVDNAYKYRKSKSYEYKNDKFSNFSSCINKDTENSNELKMSCGKDIFSNMNLFEECNGSPGKALSYNAIENEVNDSFGKVISPNFSTFKVCTDFVDNPNSKQNKDLIQPTMKQDIYTKMKYELNRLHSFDNNWPLSYIKPKDLARAGFFYLQVLDKVQCPFCYGIIYNWTLGDDPLKEHSKNFSLCPFLMGQDVGNVPYDEHIFNNELPESLYKFPGSVTSLDPSITSSHQSVNTNPKNPRMSNINTRLNSFKGWPLTMLKPQDLAECGFYYTGVADVVTCFYCGGSLGTWDIGDDPRHEHSKFFPTCSYIQQSQPNKTIINKNESTSACNLEKPSTSSSSSSQEIINKAKEMFPEPLVDKVVQEYNIKQRNFESIEELCEELLKTNEKNKEVKSPASTNEVQSSSNTKDILTCQICMDNERSMVFIPCGHFISCLKCSLCLKKCPICRTKIQNSIRAYFN